MAVINAGDLKHKVTFKAPTSAKNDEGGLEATYDIVFETHAAVRNVSNYRSTEAGSTSQLKTKEFFIRWANTRTQVTKDWILVYGDIEWIIDGIDPVEEGRNRFIKFTAKSKGEAVSDAPPVTTYTDVVFDSLLGALFFQGQPLESWHLLRVVFADPLNPNYGYVSAEGNAYSVGPSSSGHISAEYFTPGNVLVKWQILSASNLSAVTGYSEKVIEVTQLSRRWLRVWNLSNIAEWTAGDVEVYNVAGEVSGVATTLEELISVWNSDPVNQAFGTIIGQRQYPETGNAQYYELQVEPVLTALVYPIKMINVRYV